MSEQPANSNDPDPVFEAIDLKKEFDEGNVKALRGVNFKIDPGEFVSIVGPSGSGKTTLLHMLGSLDLPSSGELKFKGTNLPDLPDYADYRAREVGFIFQSFHLLPTFTIRENVQIPTFGLPGSARERKARAVELLNAVGLSHRLDHLPSKLSGGERQRAAIARSMVNNPGVLLADEPTGNLDTENAAQIMELLDLLQEEHKTTLILVTHDMDVASHASREIRMLDGKIASDSSKIPKPQSS